VSPPAEGPLSGVGRSELIDEVLKLRDERDSLKRQLSELAHEHALWKPTVRVALNEHEAMVETLTAAQAAGTEAQLGRQRARALLRQLLATNALSDARHERVYADRVELDVLESDIRKELGS
jgi:hypothetical protein